MGSSMFVRNCPQEEWRLGNLYKILYFCYLYFSTLIGFILSDPAFFFIGVMLQSKPSCSQEIFLLGKYERNLCVLSCPRLGK